MVLPLGSPIVVCPVFETLNTVVVAVAVDDAIAKRVLLTKVSFAKTWTESLAKGDVVPTPSRLLVLSIESRSWNEMFDDVVQYAKRSAEPEPVTEPEPPTHVPEIAKQPAVMLTPTFEVVVACPTMSRPRSVVVPKPSPAMDSAAVEVVAKVDGLDVEM
jgi:hypothetical protein